MLISATILSLVLAAGFYVVLADGLALMLCGEPPAIVVDAGSCCWVSVVASGWWTWRTCTGPIDPDCPGD